jgi:hypothetical protein
MSVIVQDDNNGISVRYNSTLSSLAVLTFTLNSNLKLWSTHRIPARIKTSVQASFESKFYDPYFCNELCGAGFFLSG